MPRQIVDRLFREDDVMWVVLRLQLPEVELDEP
jgi:hypothetical protein